MTFREPLLFLRTLLVFYKGAPVYNQTFHNGVNIIRGQNGHGKSTVSDFIFYALGGEVLGWKPEAERCDTVIAELELNEVLVTVRRSISEMRGQPMEMFLGSLSDAL